MKSEVSDMEHLSQFPYLIGILQEELEEWKKGKNQRIDC